MVGLDINVLEEKILSNQFRAQTCRTAKPQRAHQSDARTNIARRRGAALHKRKKTAASPEKIRGEYSENIAFAVFSSLVKRGSIPKPVEPIRRTAPNKHEDRKKLDIIYVTDRGPLSFQIKSGEAAQKKFLEKYPHIMCFAVVNVPADKALLAAQMVGEIWIRYEKLL